MKPSPTPAPMPGWLRTLILGVLLTVFVLLPVHAFFSTWGGTAVGPLWLWKSWKELLLAATTVVALGWVVSRPQVIRELLKDYLVLAVLAYVGLSLVMAGVGYSENGRDAALAGLGMNLRYFLGATLAYLLFRFSELPPLTWRRRAVAFLVSAGVALALLGTLQVLWLSPTALEYFGYGDETIAPAVLIDENPDAPRAFATLRGPNDFGAYLILPLLLSVMLAARRRWAWIGVGLMVIGLFESSSRSAWLGASAALAALAFLSPGGINLRSSRVQLGIGAALVAAAALLVAAVSIPSVRLEVFHSSPGDPSIFEGSTAAHFQSTGSGIRRVVEQPLGCGVGCAGPASYYGEHAYISENYYVQIAEEVGLLGGILWGVIAGLVAVRLYRLRHELLARALLASFIGLAVIGAWLHVWADDPVSLTWWILAGAVMGVAGRKTQKAL